MPSFAPSQPSRVRLRWPLVLGVVVAIPALIALLGYLVAPGIVRGQLESILTRELGRATKVEQVRVHPFSLEIRIEGLTIAGSAVPLARIEAIEIDGSIASLWHWAPVIDALRIIRPALAFARVDAQRYDISDLIDRALAPAPPDAHPQRYSINNVEIVDGSVDFDDRPMQRKHVLDGVRIGIPFLSSLPYDAEIKVTPALAARVNGTPLALEGALTPFAERPEATLAVDLDRLPLAHCVDYLPVRLRYRLAGGELTTRITVAFAQGPPAEHRLSATGVVSVDALELRRADGAPIAAAQRIEAELSPLDVSKRSLNIARLDATGARLALRRRDDGSLELADPWLSDAPLAPPSVPKPGAPASGAPTPAWQFAVARARVAGDEISVEDASVSPTYRLRVSAFEASAEALSSAPGEALWRVPKIVVAGIEVEADAQRVHVGEVRVEQPRMRLRREADGTVNFARLVKTAPTEAKGGDAWRVLLERFVIAGGRLDFSDVTTKPAAAFAFNRPRQRWRADSPGASRCATWPPRSHRTVPICCAGSDSRSKA